MFGGSLLVRNSLDLDALSYIAAVELADGQPLEGGVRRAINSFVVGCKSDGIWDAIKASCIMAGARTLNGALVPLKGIGPTKFNFVDGDYNRKIGLKGDGVNKYLSTNRRADDDPQDNYHNLAYITEYIPGGDLISSGETLGDSLVGTSSTRGTVVLRSRSDTNVAIVLGNVDILGLVGHSRDPSSYIIARANQQNTVTDINPQPLPDNFVSVFARFQGRQHTSSRLSFYSVGESIDLALIEQRIATLMNDFNTHIN